MSEDERIRRQKYKRNRKRWILIQAIVIAVAAIISISSFLVYNGMNRTYYIEYTEASRVDYTVQYKDNGFFEDEWLPSGQSYVSSLVNQIKADFLYKMNMDTSRVGFDYTYKAVAQVIVADKSTGVPIFSPTDVLIPETTKHVSDTNGFALSESVMVDFVKYNTLADQFVNVYELSNTTSTLIVSFSVDVISTSAEFETNKENGHTVSVKIPLRAENFSVDALTSVPSGESKVLACKDDIGQRVFFIIGVVSTALAALLVLALIAFVYLTKNEDVNYANKVRKILSSYRSFIQRIDGEFETGGYQLVAIKSFNELLCIRDTIQSPILMSENKDETRAQFLIPTNTKILYLFEIKVDNYDEIYGKEAGGEADTEAEISPVLPEETVVSPSEEKEPIANKPEEQESIENTEDAENEEDSGEEIAVYDENNNKILIKCTRSCLANIIQSDNGEAKNYYSEIKNRILSYKGVKARMSWKHESFNKGRTQLFKLKIRGKTVCLYCALNPEEFEVTKYFHKAVSAKVYEKVPMLVKIRSERALARAKRLIDKLMADQQIRQNGAYTPLDYVAEHPYERTQALIDKGLIKILVPDGYVAVDPYHIVKAEEQAKLEAVSAVNEDNELTDTEDSGEEIAVYDENNNKILIKCTRSCLANIIQSDNGEAKNYYSEIKNRILSYKGVKARMSWKHESFNKGRTQLFKLKIRGKTVCLYCALNPEEFEVTKYFHKAVSAKAYEKVPMLVKIRSERALARAKRLIDKLMADQQISQNGAYTSLDYVAEHPYERTQALIDKGLIKILVPENSDGKK